MQDEVADTGLMMMGHRFYEPDLGRFLNRDPIGFSGGLNLFEYAANSPARHSDPTGLYVWGPAVIRLLIGLGAEAVGSSAAGGAALGYGVSFTTLIGGVSIAHILEGRADARILEILASLDDSWSTREFDPNNADGLIGRALMFARMANAAGKGICSNFGPANSGRTGWQPANFNVSRPAGMPFNVNAYLNWLRGNDKRLRDSKMYYSSDEVDAILREGLGYGLAFRLDSAHTGLNPWTHPHFNIENININVHIPVPPGYTYP